MVTYFYILFLLLSLPTIRVCHLPIIILKDVECPLFGFYLLPYTSSSAYYLNLYLTNNLTLNYRRCIVNDD